MRCRICGGSLEALITDLPFKVGDFSIVILKALPVLQCRQCGEVELEHQIMLRVDEVCPLLISQQNSKSFDTPRKRSGNNLLLQLDGGVSSLY